MWACVQIRAQIAVLTTPRLMRAGSVLLLVAFRNALVVLVLHPPTSMCHMYDRAFRELHFSGWTVQVDMYELQLCICTNVAGATR